MPTPRHQRVIAAVAACCLALTGCSSTIVLDDVAATAMPTETPIEYAPLVMATDADLAGRNQGAAFDHFLSANFNDDSGRPPSELRPIVDAYCSGLIDRSSIDVMTTDTELAARVLSIDPATCDAFEIINSVAESSPSPDEQTWPATVDARFERVVWWGDAATFRDHAEWFCDNEPARGLPNDRSPELSLSVEIELYSMLDEDECELPRRLATPGTGGDPAMRDADEPARPDLSELALPGVGGGDASDPEPEPPTSDERRWPTVEELSKQPPITRPPEPEPILESWQPLPLEVDLVPAAATGDDATLYLVDGPPEAERIYAIYLGTGASAALTPELPRVQYRESSVSITTSPTGDQIALGWRYDYDQEVVAVGPTVRQAAPLRLREGGGPIYWSGDASSLIYQDQLTFARPTIVRHELATGDIETLSEDFHYGGALLGIVGGNRVVHQPCGDPCRIGVTDLATGEEVSSFAGSGYSATLAPTGDFVVAVGPPFEPSLHIIDLTGEGLAERTNMPFDSPMSFDPHISPDGQWIMSSTLPWEPLRIARTDQLDFRALLEGRFEDYWPKTLWLPDSSAVVFQSYNQDRNSPILRVDIFGNQRPIGLTGKIVGVLPGDPEGLANGAN